MQQVETLGVKGWGRIYAAGDVQKTGNEVSHVLLNGGRLSVPMNDYEKVFISKVADDILHNNQNYICEQRTDIFRMCANLDVLQNPNNEEEIMEEVFEDGECRVKPGLLLRKWLSTIQDVMRDLYKNAPSVLKNRQLCGCKNPKTCNHILHRLTAVVCMCFAKRGVLKNKEAFTKIGIHVVWPFINCQSDKALNVIRKAWIQRFECEYGLRPSYNPWENVFDKSIYGKNGLRMIGSDMMENCPTCKGKKSMMGMCQSNICDGTLGKYPENRVYRVVDALKPSGQTDDFVLSCIKQSPYTELLFTYIRTYNATVTQMALPEWFDENFFVDDDDTHQLRFAPNPTQKLQLRQQIEKMPENRMGEQLFLKSNGTTKVKRIDANDPIICVIKEWIKSKNIDPKDSIPEPYRNVDILDVKICSIQGGKYPYYLVRINSCFCMNIGKEHSHNGVFFYINENGLYQRCFCTCETTEGRVTKKKCKNYASSPYRMPIYVVKILFPALYENYQRLTSVTNPMFMTEEDTAELIDLQVQDLDQRYDQIMGRRQSYMLNTKRYHQKGKYESYEQRFKSKRKDL